MALAGFPVAAFPIDRIGIAYSTAVIALQGIAVPLCQRIIAVRSILAAYSHTVVLGPVGIPDGYGAVIRVVSFPDGHTVFLGMGIMTDGHGTAARGQHIAAQGYGIGRIGQPGHHQVAVYEGSVRSIVAGPGGGDISLIVQPVPGIGFYAGQFAIAVHIIGGGRIQHFGLVAQGRGIRSFRNVIDTHRRGAAHIVGLAAAVRADIRGHVVIDFHCFVVICITGIVRPLRGFGPHIVGVIHILSGHQAVYLNLLFFVLLRCRIIHFRGNPLGIDIFIRIGRIIGNRFHRIRGMGKRPHPVAGTHNHIFRLVFHPGIAGFGIGLDLDYFVVLAGNQVPFAVVGHIGIAALGRGIRVLFNVDSLAGRCIVLVGGLRIRCDRLGPH